MAKIVPGGLRVGAAVCARIAYGSCVRMGQTCQNAQQSRLAGAIRPSELQRFAGANPEVQPLEQDPQPPGGSQVLDLKDW